MSLCVLNRQLNRAWKFDGQSNMVILGDSRMIHTAYIIGPESWEWIQRIIVQSRNDSKLNESMVLVPSKRSEDLQKIHITIRNRYSHSALESLTLTVTNRVAVKHDDPGRRWFKRRFMWRFTTSGDRRWIGWVLWPFTNWMSWFSLCILYIIWSANLWGELNRR